MVHPHRRRAVSKPFPPPSTPRGRDNTKGTPEFYIKKFETGLSGEFGFSPSAAIGFKKGIKLPEDKGKFKLAQFRGYTFTFMVGPVPVAIEVSPYFYMIVDAEASGAIQLGFRYEYANRFKSGIRYQNKKWGAHQGV